jgi:hypothetical protein
MSLSAAVVRPSPGDGGAAPPTDAPVTQVLPDRPHAGYGDPTRPEAAPYSGNRN